MNPDVPKVKNKLEHKDKQKSNPKDNPKVQDALGTILKSINKPKKLKDKTPESQEKSKKRKELIDANVKLSRKDIPDDVFKARFEATKNMSLKNADALTLSKEELEEKTLEMMNKELGAEGKDALVKKRIGDYDKKEALVGPGGMPLKDKEGNIILKSKFEKLQKENPAIKQMVEKIGDDNLAKELLAIYGEENFGVYSKLISKLPNGKTPKTLEEFDELISEAVGSAQDKVGSQISANKEAKQQLLADLKSDPGYRARVASRIANSGPLVQGKPRNIDLSNLPKGIKGLLHFIAQAENSSMNYNAIFGKEKSSQPFEKPLSEMTVKEVIQAQRQYKKVHGYRSAAIGAYQFMDYTLADMAKNGSISLNDKFTNEFQDKIATIKLKQRGLDSFMSGKLSRDQFQVKLSQEWASLPKDESGASYYSGDGLNHALVSNAQLDKVLDNLKSGGVETTKTA